MSARAWLAFVLASALPSTSHGFCLATTCDVGSADGPCRMDQAACLPQKWAGGCLGYVVESSAAHGSDLDYDEARALVRAAFATWLAADCGGGRPPGLRVYDLGPSDCQAREYHPGGRNTNVWIFSDREWSDPHQLDAYAVTVRHFDASGALRDADVEVNATALSGVDLQFVLTHEAGHVLGLGHSSVAGSWMTPGYSLELAQSGELHADDVAAICAAYPPGGDQASCEPTPEGGPFRRCGPSEVTAHGCSASGRSGEQGQSAVLLMACFFGVAASRKAAMIYTRHSWSPSTTRRSRRSSSDRRTCPWRFRPLIACWWWRDRTPASRSSSTDRSRRAC